MNPLVFWLLVCNPTASQCSVEARVRHEDYAHTFAEALASERPTACVMVTKRGEVESIYGHCLPWED